MVSASQKSAGTWLLMEAALALGAAAGACKAFSTTQLLDQCQTRVYLIMLMMLSG